VLAVNAVYVAHYNKLVERKKHLLGQLLVNNIECFWFEQEPNKQEIRKKYDGRVESWNKKILQVPYPSSVPYKQLNRAEISLAHKHIKIYEDIIKNNFEFSLILEDDVVFCDDFTHKFNFNMYETPRDWDFIFIGSGCNLRIDKTKTKEGKNAYLKQHPASKCTDSYVVKKDAVKKIMNTMEKYSFPIDFELNYQMCINKMNVYWWDPPLVTQGSQNGLYSSEIQK
jgi:GR25 family glycosyltransferase involved in LPS biosynthesis